MQQLKLFEKWAHNNLKTIELTKSNYKGHLPIDVAAFSFAAAGAMGEHGGVIIVDSDAQVYHLNYVHGEWGSFDDIIEICPLLKECDFTVFGYGSKVPDGYQFANLGFGNFLVVKGDFWKEFNDMKDSYKGNKILYNTWADFMLEILKWNDRR